MRKWETSVQVIRLSPPFCLTTTTDNTTTLLSSNNPLQNFFDFKALALLHCRVSSSPLCLTCHLSPPCWAAPCTKVSQV